jgi:hypothetical protein
MEFAGVELATSEEKAMTDMARVVITLVEKAVRALEKATMGKRLDGDGGRWVAALLRWRCGPAGLRTLWRTTRRRRGARSWWSTVAALQWRAFWRMKTIGYG